MLTKETQSNKRVGVPEMYKEAQTLICLITTIKFLNAVQRNEKHIAISQTIPEGSFTNQ